MRIVSSPSAAWGSGDGDAAAPGSGGSSSGCEQLRCPAGDQEGHGGGPRQQPQQPRRSLSIVSPAGATAVAKKRDLFTSSSSSSGSEVMGRLVSMKSPHPQALSVSSAAGGQRFLDRQLEMFSSPTGGRQPWPEQGGGDDARRSPAVWIAPKPERQHGQEVGFSGFPSFNGNFGESAHSGNSSSGQTSTLQARAAGPGVFL